ncbi:hypothetical protein [Sphaerisporangium sp. NPDC051011]|uniref:hypothetical protein n=1 Tax=Sphaerisporangium sp. NPDC051011 TaxID=3155792 RepID=UPI0033E0081E
MINDEKRKPKAIFMCFLAVAPFALDDDDIKGIVVEAGIPRSRSTARRREAMLVLEGHFDEIR